jgi:hypothetical protein
MKRWKSGLFGLASVVTGYAFGCGCALPLCLPGLPCDFSCSDISFTTMADVIQDILFANLFD